MKKAATIFLFCLFCAQVWGQGQQPGALYKEGKYAEAAEVLEQQYKRFPEKTNVPLLLKCYKALKQYDAAEKLIKKEIKKRNSPELWVDRGYFQQLNKEAEEAEKSFAKALEFLQKQPSLAYNISDRFKHYGLYNYALKTFEYAEKINPNLAFHYQKGLIYAELGDIENMYAEYLALIEQSPTYLTSVKQRISRNLSNNPENEANQLLKKQLIKKIQETQNPLFTELLAWLYIEEKAYNKALRQLVSLDKRENNRDAEIFDLGNQAVRNTDFETGIACYKHLVAKGEIGPFYADALYKQQRTLQVQLNTAPSVKNTAYKQLIKENTALQSKLLGTRFYIDLKRNTAEMLYFNTQQKDSAINLLTNTISKFKSNFKFAVGECKMLLGDFLLAENQPVEAIFEYMKVERQFSGSELGDQAKYMKGMVAYYTADFPWALNQFEVLKSSTTKLISNDALQMALLITDNSVEDTLYQGLSYYAKADLFRFRNLPDSALATIDLLLSVFPNHAIKAEATLMQAELLYKIGDANAAISALKNLTNNKEGDIWTDDALMLLANYYQDALGDKENAMAAYETILFEHPGSTFVPEARRKYRALRGDDLQ